MQLHRITIGRWMVVVAIASVFVVAVALILAPILRDIRERENDAHWLGSAAYGVPNGGY
jgi:threonine/homoserine efflux transporter RhtA